MSARQPRGRHRAASVRPGRHREPRPAGPRHAQLTGRRGRGRLVTAVTAVLLLTGGGVAVGAWVASGQGPAAGQATTAQEVVIAAATPVAQLYPGGSGSLRLTVANPNPYPVRLTQASFGAVAVTPLSGRTCLPANVTTAGPLTLASPLDLPASSTPVPLTIPNAITLITTADNGCQDATFTVTVTLSGTST